MPSRPKYDPDHCVGVLLLPSLCPPACPQVRVGGVGVHGICLVQIWVLVSVLVLVLLPTLCPSSMGCFLANCTILVVGLSQDPPHTHSLMSFPPNNDDCLPTGRACDRSFRDS